MTISLTRAGISEEDALTGDLDITESLIITGNDGGTTIDGAGKLSGRVGAWSIGALEAVTARAFASVDSAMK